MKDIVTKTLKLEKLNSPKLELNFTNINVFESVSKIINNKQYVSSDKKLDVKNTINDKLNVFADQLEFNELIDNLLTNAIKFTGENGSICFNAEKNKDFINISISDTGIGLSKEEINHIFDEFYKVDPSRHDLEASGLGLSICQRIVERHEGRIWVESLGLGKGSTFYVSLPYKKKT